MTETKLKIDGMMCGMCESHINDAIRRAFNVKKVTSSHSKGETTVGGQAVGQATTSMLCRRTAPESIGS